jgi:ABC-type transport system involved in multi-copper enzyme maturation permease subunit
MKGIFLQILFAFKRDAIFFGTTILILLCTGFAIFLGSNAVVEEQEAKIIYTAGLSRISIALGFMSFVVFYIKRMFDSHEIEVILSHPISRYKVVIAMFFAFSVALYTLIIPIGIVLFVLKANIINTIIWCFSIYLEGLIMLSFTLCCSLIINSFVHSLSACFVMYLVGRVIGNFVAYITVKSDFGWKSILSSVLKISSIFLPRLDIFGKTSWLVYGNFSSLEVLLFTVQAVIFCCIFLCIASLDLNRKEF